MGRGMTTDEFADAHGPSWVYHGGIPGDPGIVTESARRYGDMYGLDAEELDHLAEADGWEHHDPGYDGKIRGVAERLAEQREQAN